jgi:hypothetical protein
VWTRIIKDVVFDFFGTPFERAARLLLLQPGLPPAMAIATISCAATLIVVVVIIVAPGPLGSRDDCWLDIALVSHFSISTRS